MADHDVGAPVDAFDQPGAARRDDDVLLGLALAPARRPSAPLVRGFDIVGAAALLLLAAPILLVVALAVVIADGRPILFRQGRVGRHGEVFEILKFRTMGNGSSLDWIAADADTAREFAAHRKLRRDPRVTATGRFLRRSRLDELPQFWNVLRGEMSLVGPRPVVAGEIRRYGSLAQIAFSVKPGMTGSWQVESSNAADYDQRVDLDVRFACDHSFRRLVALAVRTPLTVITSVRRGEFR